MIIVKANANLSNWKTIKKNVLNHISFQNYDFYMDKIVYVLQ